MLSLTEVLVALIAFAFVAYYFTTNNNKQGYNFPPGPWGIPIFGHLLFFGSNPGEKFLEWKQIYGPIITVRFGSFRAIVLNDVKMIREAFNMTEFSGRPFVPVLNEVANKKGYFTSENPKVVEQRKFAIRTLREINAGPRLTETRVEEISKFIISIKAKIREREGKPFKMNRLFQLPIVNTFWDIFMGGRFEENDPTVRQLIHYMDKGADINSTIIAQLFWFFPWVAKLGNAVGYNPPVHAVQNLYTFFEKELKKAKHVYVKGQPQNFSHVYFDKVSETSDPNSSFHESDNQQPFCTGDLFIASTDTAVNFLDWLLIYMAMDSETQGKLQEEIDSIISLDKSRVPCLSDRPKMPFTNAVIEDLLRVGTVTPLGLFHRTITDVVFKGYKIPKDTMIISNLYGVHRDPEVWSNPEKLDPSRFLDDETGQFRKTDKTDILPFSTGKRICIGEGLARDTMFLMATNFFREFSVSCTERIPSLEPIIGIASSPRPFELNIKVR